MPTMEKLSQLFKYFAEQYIPLWLQSPPQRALMFAYNAFKCILAILKMKLRKKLILLLKIIKFDSQNSQIKNLLIGNIKFYNKGCWKISTTVQLIVKIIKFKAKIQSYIASCVVVGLNCVQITSINDQNKTIYEKNIYLRKNIIQYDHINIKGFERYGSNFRVNLIPFVFPKCSFSLVTGKQNKSVDITMSAIQIKCN